MKNSRKDVYVTQTAQFRSAVQLNEKEKKLTINTPDKSEEEKQIGLILSLSDSLSILYENLNKLSNLGKIMEKELKKVN